MTAFFNGKPTGVISKENYQGNRDRNERIAEPGRQGYMRSQDRERQMKDENRTELRSWRERLLMMNLILPILEIGIIGEALWLAVAIGLALLSQLGRLRRRKIALTPQRF